ncbi:MAG: aspartyl protease family protein [Bacteroidia bacterium]|nr:aspartyl protease family protein [Bacteroidia bacterium]MBT8276453.1 aspartyl protease family protein [Bacteroidia bacterium]NNF30377.1 PDZ domain-containing protein [Flavobacteriaceae bacterium]NNK53478.1 PDZ domain-containing protein [Flavobacteriaceae bacterium]NNM08738.1 PDZ domain-containing protein [Flavobacteriaceae bacterium]
MEKLANAIRTIFLLAFSLLLFSVVNAQSGFKLPQSSNRDKIPFELVNNLVVIPVEINGTELSFLLDTGVSSTLLFSVDDLDSLQLNNAQPVKLRGLGEGGSIDALVSNNNTIKVGEAIDTNHRIFMVMDKKINFSTRMGVPIHGIIGFELYKDFVIKTDYTSKRITLYRPEKFERKRCKSCEVYPIVFYNRKPFLSAQIASEHKESDALLLIDTGSSDGLWLFDEEDFITENPKNYFKDFLGLGLSGNIFGLRSKIRRLALNSFQFEKVTTSFPDSNTVRNIRSLPQRKGSLGSEVLRRFTVIMDYRKKTMILKKNSRFDDPFYYNMAGLTLEHDGLIPVKEVDYFKIDPVTMATEKREASAIFDVYKSPTLQFFLAPKYVVAEVREGSPAALVGVMKGDEVVRINGKASYKYKLYEVINLFSSKAGRTISLDILRNGILQKKKFVLREVL